MYWIVAVFHLALAGSNALHWYDGCNWHTYLGNGAEMVTNIYCGPFPPEVVPEDPESRLVDRPDCVCDCEAPEVWLFAPAIGSQNPNDYPVGAWESR